MKLLILTLLTTLFLFNSNLKADEIKVSKADINSINITLSDGFFTVIELENEIINYVPLNTKSLQVQKLNNKSVLIFAYDNNLPETLGKVIINDSACNSYAINLKRGKQTKDQVIAITNSNKSRTCNNDTKNGFRATADAKILYSNK